MKKHSNSKGLVGRYTRMGGLDFSNNDDLTKLRDRLSVETDFHESGCYLWEGAKVPDGYGKLKVNGRIRPVHRVAYEAFVKMPEPGNLVRHKCDVRNCWNPKHLEEGTYRDNAIDCVTRGRHASGKTELRVVPMGKGTNGKDHCVNGHAYAGKNLRIDILGYRRCRACAAANRRLSRANRSKISDTRKK